MVDKRPNCCPAFALAVASLATFETGQRAIIKHQSIVSFPSGPPELADSESGTLCCAQLDCGNYLRLVLFDERF